MCESTGLRPVHVGDVVVARPESGPRGSGRPRTGRCPTSAISPLVEEITDTRSDVRNVVGSEQPRAKNADRRQCWSRRDGPELPSSPRRQRRWSGNRRQHVRRGTSRSGTQSTGGTIFSAFDTSGSMNRPCTYGGWYHSQTESIASFQLPLILVLKPYRWVIRWKGYASSCSDPLPEEFPQRRR